MNVTSTPLRFGPHTGTPLRAGRSLRLRRAAADARGFTLLELFMIMAIVAILCALAVGVTPGVMRSMKGNTGNAQIESFLRTARESAIARRRTVRVSFTSTNRMQALEVNPSTAATTVLQTVILEQNLTYRQFTGQGDTPDGFGAGSATQFGGTAPVGFNSEGQFVDSTGTMVNGTVFVGQAGFPNTAAAVTIFGPTARLQSWKWNSAQWTE